MAIRPLLTLVGPIPQRLPDEPQVVRRRGHDALPSASGPFNQRVPAAGIHAPVRIEHPLHALEQGERRWGEEVPVVVVARDLDVDAAQLVEQLGQVAALVQGGRPGLSVRWDARPLPRRFLADALEAAGSISAAPCCLAMWRSHLGVGGGLVGRVHEHVPYWARKSSPALARVSW
jgi:hypothetical protein